MRNTCLCAETERSRKKLEPNTSLLYRNPSCVTPMQLRYTQTVTASGKVDGMVRANKGIVSKYADDATGDMDTTPEPPYATVGSFSSCLLTTEISVESI